MTAVVEDVVRSLAVVLPSGPASVAAGRRHVRTVLTGWDLGALADTACLLVSELVTNSLLHARTDLEVRVARDGAQVRVTVLDGSPGRPVRRRHGLHASTGRGLGLVETLSCGWGTTDGDEGWAKGVWFALPADAALLPTGQEGALYGDDWLALVADL